MRRVSLLARTAASVRRWTGLQAWHDWRMSGALILVYHGVAKNLRHDELDTYQITQSELRRHVRYLKSFADIIPLSELLQRAEAEVPRKQRLAAITFDDALVSQVTLAADVMCEFSVPWSIAVPAGLVEHQEPVWTNLVRLMVRFLPCDGRPLVGGRFLDERLLGQSGSLLIQHLMYQVTSVQRDQQIQELLHSVGPDRMSAAINDDGRFLTATWSQLRDALGADCEILGHGWKHRPHNSLIDEKDRWTEIVEARKLIEQRMGISPVCFAYPHGITNEKSAEILSTSGYKFALSTRASWFTKVDRWNVPRFDGEYSLDVLRRHLTWRRP